MSNLDGKEHSDNNKVSFYDLSKALSYWRSESDRLQSIISKYSYLRLLNIMSILFLAFFWWPLKEAHQIFILSILLLPFLFFLKQFWRFTSALGWAKAMLFEYEIEYNQAQSKPALNNDGEDYHRADHPCAEDLQFWGPGGLFQRINRCFSRSGSDLLAQHISLPPVENWRERQHFFQEVANEFHWSLACRAEARNLQEEKLAQRLQFWLNRGQKPLSVILRILMLLGKLASLVALTSLILNPDSTGFKIFSGVMLFNLLLTFSRAADLRYQQREAAALSDSLRSYRGLLVRLAQKQWQSDLAQKHYQRLFGPLSAQIGIRRLASIAGALEHLANVFVLLFLNGLFHYHLHQLQALARWQAQYGPALSTWFDALAHWEEAFSVAAYIRQHPHFHWPQASTSEKLEAEELKHPFLEPQQAVGNDFSLAPKQWLILTGSNMSGKSTFLRSLGLNLQLAQMGLPVAATRFYFYPCQILSSMSPRDSLLQNQSYFQAEISRLQALQARAASGPPAFWLLDEILRGTNSLDKRQGTEAFLRKLARSPHRGILATHDVEVAGLADSNPRRFLAFYFDSEVQGRELFFDYRLRAGLCDRPNAHQLMLRYGIIDDEDETVDNLGSETEPSEP